MLITDGFLFIVSQNQPSSTRQAVRQLLQCFRFTLPGFFIAQGITHLDSQFVIRDIEIDLITVIIEEHATVVNVMAIDTEQVNRHKILQEHRVLIDKEQPENAGINEVVLTVAFLISQGRCIIPESQEQPCLLTILHIFDGSCQTELSTNARQEVIDAVVGDRTANAFCHLSHEHTDASHIGNLVTGDDITHVYFLIDAAQIVSLSGQECCCR